MDISIISFTKRGEELAERVQKVLRGKYGCMLYTKRENAKDKFSYVAGPLQDWSMRQIAADNVLIFIGACGVAVRSISQSMENKFIGNPVIVMDEAGEYVVPVISGHFAGANIIARQIAKALGASPVITTAIEGEHPFVIDAFAVENDLWIDNHGSAAKISARLLENRKITMSIASGSEGKIPEGIIIHPYPIEYDVDILIAAQKSDKYMARLQLVPHSVVLGMDCKGGQKKEDVEHFILGQLEALRIPTQALRALAVLDLRKEEEGFLAFAEKYGLEFYYQSADTLAKIRGDFSDSPIEWEHAGLNNVCERAAIHAAGTFGKMLLKQTTQEGIALAIAEKPWKVVFDEI